MGEPLDQDTQRAVRPAARKRERLRGIFPRLGVLPVVLAVMFGILGGIGAFTFGYGQGFSYLLNDPRACANCHVMDDHFESWQHSSHRHVAKCNDCHLPHNFIGKWVTKSDNGFFHSLAFTLGDFHDPIQIKPRNRRVTQHACLDCHQEFVHPIMAAAPEGESMWCARCHGDVGHAERPTGSMNLMREAAHRSDTSDRERTPR